MLLTVLLLLPLAMAAPTPQGFSTGLAARSLIGCSPTVCDPPSPGFFSSYGPIVKDPSVGSCDPQLCDPVESELDISKRSPIPDPSSYVGISAITLASARPVEPESDTEPADHGNGLGRRGDGIIKSERGWVPDRDWLVKDESKKLKSKRALEPLSPDRLGVVNSGSGVNNGAVKRADRTTVVVNNGKRAVDGGAEREAHTGIGSGIVIGSKEKRDAKPGSAGDGGGTPLQIVGDAVQKRSIIGVGNFLDRAADSEVQNGAISIPLGGSGNEKRSDLSESGQVRSGATVVFSNPEENEKRSDGSESDQVSGGAVIVFLNREDNEKRSDVSGSNPASSGSNTVPVNPEGNAKRSGISVSNQVSSGSNTVLVSPEGNAKRSGVSGGNQVE